MLAICSPLLAERGSGARPLPLDNCSPLVPDICSPLLDAPALACLSYPLKSCFRASSGSLWTSSGNVWTFWGLERQLMATNGNLWQLIATCGNLWQLMASQGAAAVRDLTRQLWRLREQKAAAETEVPRESELYFRQSEIASA